MLTGPNGHGKSRCLRVLATQWQKLRNYLSVLLRKLGVEDRSLADLSGAEADLLFLVIYRAFLSDPDDPRGVERRAEVDQHLAKLQGDADSHRKIRMSRRMPQAVRSAKALPDLVLISHSRVRDISRHHEMQGLTSRAEPYLHEIAKRIYMRAYADYRRTHAAELAQLDSFRTTLRALLGAEVEAREINDRAGSIEVPPYMFGHALNLEELSEGQRILLGWAILVHEEGGKLRDSILLFDEPELHLHPEACIQGLNA